MLFFLKRAIILPFFCTTLSLNGRLDGDILLMVIKR